VSLDVLNHIRDVIQDMTVPSWFTSVPSNFGAASAGTMKADEWRSLITVYIPIALVSLWGAGTSHSSDEVGTHLRAVLDHTMELVCAVYLACARTMTVERAHAYRSHIARYVGDLKKVYPTSTLRPNHHAAFHIYDYLLLFGPAHSWWCFPFERLIGVLQRLPTNHKSGEMETTMLHSFIKAMKLRCWLSRPDCPLAIQECKVLFDRMYAFGFKDELAEDPLDDSVRAPPSAIAVATPEDLYALIKRQTAILRAHLKFNGIIYSRASTHVGNSQILFYPHGDRLSSPVPGSIQYIYATPIGELMFAVRRHFPLDRHYHVIDPFAVYPHFPAKLYMSNLSTHLENVKVSWVTGHFARWSVSNECVVIISLSHD